jgi:transposase
MDEQELFIGIDVSQDKLDVGVWPTSELWVVNNTDEGVVALIQKLTALQPKLVVLEATGGLERPAVHSLAAAGLPVVVMNPRPVRDFAKATGRLAKTDPIDALVLAHFGAAIRPPIRSLPAAEIEELDALITRRRQLVGIIAQEKNRLHRAPGSVISSIKAHIRWIQDQVDSIDKDSQGIIETNKVLQEKSILLQTFKGIGPGCSNTLIAKLPELGTIDRGKIACLAGLAPLNRDSGKYKGTRRIWGGRESVRSALYMSTIVAIRWNPTIKEFYDRLRGKGKKAKVAITACMHKILTILNAMLKSGEAWSPTHAR